MKRDRITGILAIVTAVALLLFIGLNIFKSLSNNYQTSTAVVTTVSDTVEADMFIIRQETIIKNEGSGVVVPLAVNGEKVGNGNEIAAVFDDEESAENYSDSLSLNKKLEVYQKINSQLKLANLDLEKLSSEVDSDFYSVLDAVYDNDFSDLSDNELSFSEKLSRKNISLGYDVDCSEQIADLEKQIAALNVKEPSRIITSEFSGYYVNRLDGYENLITVDSVDELTEAQLKKAMESDKAEEQENVIGKLIIGNEWYIAAFVDSADLAEVNEGKSLKIVLGDGENETVSASLYSKNRLGDGRMLAVFRCSDMNEDLVTLRKVSGKIIVKNYTGIKIRKDAVRFNESGEEGVYILEGNLVKFNRIEEVYSNDSVVVAADKSGTSGWLAQYDEIIISGKELKNGKVVG